VPLAWNRDQPPGEAVGPGKSWPRRPRNAGNGEDTTVRNPSSVIIRSD